MAEKEYIGRNEFCKHFCRCREEQCDKSQCPIWTAPAADVAEVVRCENCAHYSKSQRDGFIGGRCGRTFHAVFGKDFCSYGERKEQK